MNFIQNSKKFLLLISLSISSQADTITSQDLKKDFENIIGMQIEDIPELANNKSIVNYICSPYTYTEDQFPRARLKEELTQNKNLFKDLELELPIIMTKFSSKEALTNNQLLLAVRVSRQINSQIK